MENVEERDTPTTTDEALASIEAVNQAQADLPDRLITPWWYHVDLGLVESLLVVSIGLPTWWRLGRSWWRWPVWAPWFGRIPG